ncbi:ras-related protein Rab-28-like isoform X1 [Hylaeus volcanicus]|uniref:ras-related protein Rab-28-like isoform X1 n=1 Tax=Hylaeus volcanicus TaxID=313075 RepID=UPI0023B78D1B|nr:ras-related protein Rab-28-like isoform X1 [Hylaeus volcanicus]
MCDVEEDLIAKRLKIVLVGDSGSGKTSIAQKFCSNEFTRQYTQTSGIDFFLKNISIGYYKNVNLHLWDVGGLALHGNMLDKYVFGAHIILFVYDITNSFSFDVLEEWLDKIREVNNKYEETPLMAVVGNKCDMEHQRTVKKDRSHKFAAENGFPSHDVSARTGEAVSLCIVNLAAQILGVRLTKTDQDYHKPIITAEIGDTVDMAAIHKVVKRIPNKRQNQLPFYPHLSSSKSTVCELQ